MKRLRFFCAGGFFLFSIAGCARLAEVPKVMWGSSTHALEEAREEALRKTYQTNFGECFEAVLTIARESGHTIFIQDRRKRRIVLMGAKGNVDTTEVGIFFEESPGPQTTVDITSLSTTAKEKVAGVIFEELGHKFKSLN